MDPTPLCSSSYISGVNWGQLWCCSHTWRLSSLIGCSQARACIGRTVWKGQDLVHLSLNLGCFHDPRCSIEVQLKAQQPWKACQVLGLQKWFWVGVIWRKVIPSPVPFLSFTATMHFLRAPRALHSFQDAPQTQILPSSTFELWKIFLWHPPKDTASVREERSIKIRPSVTSCDWARALKKTPHYLHTTYF